MTPRRRTTDRQPSRESQLESQRNLLDEQVHFLKQEIAQLHRVIESLAAENKVLREDAARYRWLRHGDNDEVILVPCTWTTTGYLPRNEELDAAIDAALTKEATNG